MEARNEWGVGGQMRGPAAVSAIEASGDISSNRLGSVSFLINRGGEDTVTRAPQPWLRRCLQDNLQQPARLRARETGGLPLGRSLARWAAVALSDPRAEGQRTGALVPPD